MDSEDSILQVYRSQLAKAEADHAEAVRQQADWAKRVLNNSTSITSLKHLVAMRLLDLQAEEEAAATAQELADGPEVTNTKTSFVLQLIQANPKGLTPAEIKEAGKTAGFDGSSNFPYTTLAKLKAAKKIKEDLGKYTPIAA